MNSLKLSPVIAGTMKWGAWGRQFTTDQYYAMVKDCVDLGVTTFDHADIYGYYTTEEEFGKAIAREPSLRSAIQLITKCGIRMVTPNRPGNTIKSYDTSSAYIIASAEQSLRNFHTDYIDLLLIHRPDPLMNPEEIAEAFAKLRQAGKVLHFGVSNFTVSQTDLLRACYPVTCNQVEISVLRLDPFLDGTLDQCIRQNLVPLAWSPLGGGNLFAEQDDERNRRISVVAEMLGEKYGLKADQILLNWLLLHPSGILPVLGTSQPGRVKAAMDCLRVTMEKEDWFLLWRASTGHEVP